MKYLVLLFVLFSSAFSSERLAVMDFKVDKKANLSPEERAYLSRAVRGAIINLLDPKEYIILTRDNIVALLPPNTDLAQCEDGECVINTARNLQADKIVQGRVSVVGKRLVMDMQIYESTNGAVLRDAQVKAGNVDQLVDAIKNGARELCDGMVLRGGVKISTPISKPENTYTSKTESAKKVEFSDSDELLMVQFRTEPVGAKVSLDGDKLCSATPCQKMIDTKKHTIEFELEGYKIKSIPFQPSEKNKQIDVNLSPRMGGVIIGASMGENDVVAEVYVNGELKGKTPFKKEVPLLSKVVVKYWDEEKEMDLSDLTEGGKKKVQVEFEIKTPPGMVSIPVGCFQMGSDDGDWDAGSDEKPLHRVCLSAYNIDVHEVTQGEYQSVMGSNPSNFSSCGANCPVEQVDWNQASTYCSKVGKRLPTEAEWEYAAFGAHKAVGYKYSGSNNENDVAWFTGNSGNQTHAVCTKAKNEIGLCDMSGNVWEWVSDWYSSSYYGSSPSQDPKGASSGSFRVFRGGSWLNVFASFLRSSGRDGGDPANRFSFLGFRCALSSTR